MIQRELGLVEYLPTLEAMKDFTDSRDADTPDELWLLQHPRVFTQGQAGKAEHVLAPGDIPVIQVDRGGQVTYHGPGQWVVYLLVDIRRHGMGVRKLVDLIEQSIVQLLSEHGIDSAPRADAPGVLPRTRTERGYGPGALSAHQSLWLPGAAGDVHGEVAAGC
jgi:lipoyl(octanoyl) transferase